MPKYKLTYFNLQGLGTPFGKLPILEEDGKPMTQSIAIARYLGKKAGLAGKDDWENLQIDIIADTLMDLRRPISSFVREPNEEIKKINRDIYMKETLPSYLKKLDAIAKENGGYLANKKLSWADMVFACVSEIIRNRCEIPDITLDYLNLHSLQEKIFNLPQIKKWVEKRPVVPF